MSLQSPFAVRLATPADAPIVARHRAGMFRDMGRLRDTAYDALVAEATAPTERLIATGEYVGWLASPEGDPANIVAGAGVHRRTILPRPVKDPVSGAEWFGTGEAVVVNVFTEPAWRRRGAAALLMSAVIAWARETRLDVLVLHAADAGRPLYERLGFIATNEMRFAGGLR